MTVEDQAKRAVLPMKRSAPLPGYFENARLDRPSGALVARATLFRKGRGWALIFMLGSVSGHIRTTLSFGTAL
jgi:hypothetical protein